MPIDEITKDEIDPESFRYALAIEVASDIGNKRIAVILRHSDLDGAFEIFLDQPSENSSEVSGFVLLEDHAYILWEKIGKAIQKFQKEDHE